MKVTQQQRVQRPRTPHKGEVLRASLLREIIEQLGDGDVLRQIKTGYKAGIFMGDEVPFAHQMLTPTKVRVIGGAFVVSGQQDIEVDTADWDLSGSTEYLYLEWQIDATTATIKHSSSRPVTVSPYYRFRLVSFTKSGATYGVERRSWLGGDIVVPSIIFR